MVPHQALKSFMSRCKCTVLYMCLCVIFIHVYTHNTFVFYVVIVDFNVKTTEGGLTPLLVAASCNKKSALLWLLQNGKNKVKADAVDTKGRNAIHLASLDSQGQYTIEVSDHIQLSVVCTCNRINYTMSGISTLQ